jgi:sarcosine oxidase
MMSVSPGSAATESWRSSRVLDSAGEPYQSTTCIYTRAPDGHFVLGLHPIYPQIVLASPCSGHGFKFASLFGEVLADLATKQATDKPIDLFCPAAL